MVSTEDIKKLASLSRIKIEDSEAEDLARETEAIIGYVAQIQNMTSSNESKVIELPLLRNVMREDMVTHKPNEYTEDLLANVPSREGRYLKVKKILN